MNISVVITAYNRERAIERCLQAVRASLRQDYELIVVDDGSEDSTYSVAEKYADKAIKLDQRRGPAYARTKGIETSEGGIIVSIDSDIVISPDTLSKISEFFSLHQDFDALTGLLSKEHPNKDFFSQYKNLYMNYIFGKLPQEVTFLFGSICALRRQAFSAYDLDIKTDDTALGQKLYMSGKKIAFLRDLQVVHLKKYDFFSFVKNDFVTPFAWTGVFLRYGGFKQLGKGGSGFAHSPKEQLASVIIAPVILIMAVISMFAHVYVAPLAALIFVWWLLNFNFLLFMLKERGMAFGILAFFITLLDNMVMFAGIACGFASNLVSAGKAR